MSFQYLKSGHIPVFDPFVTKIKSQLLYDLMACPNTTFPISATLTFLSLNQPPSHFRALEFSMPSTSNILFSDLHKLPHSHHSSLSESITFSETFPVHSTLSHSPPHHPVYDGHGTFRSEIFTCLHVQCLSPFTPSVSSRGA